jgi:uncharacterized protein (UPF0261 family)
MSVYLLATLDTKGVEAEFLRQRLKNAGFAVTLVDTGCLGEPTVAADCSREEVFAAARTSLAEVRQRADRGHAVTMAATGATEIVRAAHATGELDAVLAIGGSAGSTIGSAAMRVLPVGVPKVLVSTLASGQVRHFVGDRDLFMLNAVADISGINRISRPILSNAADAIAGMVRGRAADFQTAANAAGDGSASAADKPLIAATMFGVTTPCVEHARRILNDAGYEVVVFHATGSGGQAMESLIREGMFVAVLDITTTELADEHAGGFLTAGPTRLTAAGEMGIPQIVSVGATDMANFHAFDSVPPQFRNRNLYRHNASVTLMRTTVAENQAIGADLGSKLAAARGPFAVFLPLQGVSAIDRAGQPFDAPAARVALFTAIREALGQNHATEVIELDCHINDPSFSAAMARRLLEML